jgi:hypothetical protein
MAIYDNFMKTYNESAPTILTFLLILLLLNWIFKKCTEKCPETFCTCQDLANKKCPDPNELQQLYSSGKLTEFTDLASIQKQNPVWKTEMPYDQFVKSTSVTPKPNSNQKVFPGDMICTIL